ncbi:MAG: alpha/beta hydrolase [Rhodospirillales bacterium]|nr:alpha/beta hydrolase [Rhodospirillales bacterium]
MPMTEKSFLALGPRGFHRLVYFEWGDPENQRVVVCVHGLTRRGRDFDSLARALEKHYRVVCVDLPGRGQSDWLPSAEGYQPATYVQAATALIARLDVETLDWIGVSLGGLIGMMIAASPNSPIRRLVLDDVGAYVDAAPLQRISEYVGEDPAFADLAGLEAYMRTVNAGYGPLTDAQWTHLVKHGHRIDESGRYRQHYDPALGEPFKAGFSEAVDLWALWALVPCPVLLLRGACSDILTPATAAEMQARKPGMEFVEFPGVGHAPMLMDEAQIAPIARWLGQ